MRHWISLACWPCNLLDCIRYVFEERKAPWKKLLMFILRAITIKAVLQPASLHKKDSELIDASE